MPKFELRMSIACDLQQVWQVRVAVGAMLEELDFIDLDCLHVELAVAESINNCIEHAYRCGPGDPIQIYTCISGDSVTVEIVDNGLPLPLETIEALLRTPIPEPTAETALQSGGRGLPIIRSTMDSVLFARHDGRNKVTLRKLLNRHPVSEEPA